MDWTRGLHQILQNELVGGDLRAYTNPPVLDTHESRVVGGYLIHLIANFSAPRYNQLLSGISATAHVISGSASFILSLHRKFLLFPTVRVTTPAGGNFEPSL